MPAKRPTRGLDSLIGMMGLESRRALEIANKSLILLLLRQHRTFRHETKKFPVRLKHVAGDDIHGEEGHQVAEYKFRPPLKNSRLRGHPGASVGR